MQGQDPSSDLFCVVCGGPDPVADGECAACITKDLVVAKGPTSRVYVDVCRHCGATPHRDGWHRPDSLVALVEQTAIGAVEVHEGVEDLGIGVVVEARDDTTYRVDVEIEGSYRGVHVGTDVPVEVRVHGASCPACSRRHGGYFEAILQVRREGDAEVSDEEAGDIAVIIEEEIGRMGGLAGGQAYLAKVEAQHGGYDYYFGTMAAARAVAKRLVKRYAALTSESVTIHGRRDGRDIYRLTIALRIPEATPGAYVGLDGEVLHVQQRQGNRLLTRTVPNGEKRLLEERDVERAIKLDERTVDVVYAAQGEGQVLDPDTYETVAVQVPEGLTSGDKARALCYEGRWVVVGRAD